MWFVLLGSCGGAEAPRRLEASWRLDLRVAQTDPVSPDVRLGRFSSVFQIALLLWVLLRPVSPGVVPAEACVWYAAVFGILSCISNLAHFISVMSNGTLLYKALLIASWTDALSRSLLAGAALSLVVERADGFLGRLIGSTASTLKVVCCAAWFLFVVLLLEPVPEGGAAAYLERARVGVEPLNLGAAVAAALWFVVMLDALVAGAAARQRRGRRVRRGCIGSCVTVVLDLLGIRAQFEERAPSATLWLGLTLALLGRPCLRLACASWVPLAHRAEAGILATCLLEVSVYVILVRCVDRSFGLINEAEGCVRLRPCRAALWDQASSSDAPMVARPRRATSSEHAKAADVERPRAPDASAMQSASSGSGAVGGFGGGARGSLTQFQGLAVLGMVSLMVLYNTLSSWSLGAAAVTGGADALADVAGGEVVALRERLETLQSQHDRLEDRLRAVELLVSSGSAAGGAGLLAAPAQKAAPAVKEPAEAPRIPLLEQLGGGGNGAQGDAPSPDSAEPAEGPAAAAAAAADRASGAGRRACGLLPLASTSSKEVMANAGWKLDFTDFEPKANGFTGWRSHVEVGTARIRFEEAGHMRLLLRNDLELNVPDNVVRAFLNEDVLVELGPREEQWLCVDFEAGDQLLLREEYAKLTVQMPKFTCAVDGDASSSAARGPRRRPGPAVKADSARTCSKGQRLQVLLRSSACTDRGEKAQAWAEGTIKRSLSSTKAIVGLTSRARSWEQILPASRLFFEKNASGLGCDAFEFAAPKNVGIVTLADKNFRQLYKKQIDTQRCLARAHGYDMWVLESRSYRKCSKYFQNFFFLKHCVVSQFLGDQAAGYVAIVLDADVVAVVLERGLEQWTNVESDLQFYERVWNDEIAAGNYIARNTPFARMFLMQWAGWMSHQPKGYSSADNGAIHQHLVETLQLPGTDRCRKKYRALVADVSDLDPYFDFVRCTKQLLGPPRHWNVKGGGRITVWPRIHFFVADGFFINFFASNFMGPVFHHGIKDATKVGELFYDDVSTCRLSGKMLKQPREFGQSILSIVRGWKELYPQGKGCVQCVERCMHRFSCRPLQYEEEPLPKPMDPNCTANCPRQVFNIAAFKYEMEGKDKDKSGKSDSKKPKK
eukprot:TRINITY_DN26957_c0_g1_i1.p1 TRINITY_DN26957_c0_g1~~TRINITY_DN26957_c0_g1_i1.p1  ORF type:complete len:1121 (+),score=244.71 TRINITY_DN26957_c0_g1_i1:157-3519(+)